MNNVGGLSYPSEHQLSEPVDGRAPSLCLCPVAILGWLTVGTHEMFVRWMHLLCTHHILGNCCALASAAPTVEGVGIPCFAAVTGDPTWNAEASSALRINSGPPEAICLQPGGTELCFLLGGGDLEQGVAESVRLRKQLTYHL